MDRYLDYIKKKLTLLLPGVVVGRVVVNGTVVVVTTGVVVVG